MPRTLLNSRAISRRQVLYLLPSVAATLCATSFNSGCGAVSQVPPSSPSTPARSYDYNLCFVPAYGQSLSMGERGSPAISVKQRFDSLMFTGGLIAQAYSTDLAAVYASLIPLVENDTLLNFNAALTGIGNPGETPESGMFEGIKELMQSEDGLGIGEISYRFLGSCPGRGQTSITQLERGTIPYSRLLYEVNQAATLAKQMGLTFGVPCLTWLQGEADIGGSADVYLSNLQTIFQDLNADILSITGQAKSVQFIQYQTARAGCFDMACAQYQLTQTMKNVHIGTPVYPLQTDLAPWYDGVHLTSVSYKQLGAYLGSAYKRLVVNGEAWQPLSPAGITAQGSVITLALNIDKSASVVADTVTITTTRPIQPSLGFTLLDAGGNALDIDGQVSVAGADTLTIHSPQPIASGFELQYGNLIGGFGGGNIRDNFGDQYVFNGGGLNLPMHNWLTVFRYVFP